ncbi:hypothetical protein DITRI_Ditri15bG0065600 [Diplodiscus trichospermus]
MDHSLQYYPPQNVNGKVVVAPSQIFYHDGEELWKNVVVAQFIRQLPNFILFQRLTKIMWGSNEDVEVKPVGVNLFIIQFANKKTRDRVLEKGSWHIHNKPLIVRKWEPGMTSLELDPTRVLVWIQLRNVPLKLFKMEGLSYIANAVGTPLYMDRITTSHQRLAYAKICTEIDVNMEIFNSIDVKIRYELLFLSWWKFLGFL